MKDFQQVYQGDVWVMKLPDSLKVAKENELPKLHSKLVLQEGEMTGHHHYVDTCERHAPVSETPDVEDEVSFESLKSSSLKSLFGTRRADASAKFYSATKLAEQLVKDQILLRADLVVGLLEIENGPMNLYHQEHSSVALAPGKYVVGRQIESVAGEERRVAD